MSEVPMKMRKLIGSNDDGANVSENDVQLIAVLAAHRFSFARSTPSPPNTYELKTLSSIPLQK